MTLAVTIVHIANDYRRLPAYLSTDTAPRMDTMGRSGTKVDAAVPIRVDVSDLIAAIGQHAVQWEGALLAAFELGAPYWTKPRPRAVPDSLRWTAGILQSPPLVAGADGFDRPGVIPDDVALWIETTAAELESACNRVINRPRAPQRLVCPGCDCPTLFRDGARSRCVRCGLVAALEVAA